MSARYTSQDIGSPVNGLADRDRACRSRGARFLGELSHEVRCFRETDVLDCRGVRIAVRNDREVLVTPLFILVADENAGTLATLTRALEDAGYLAMATQSFQDAIRALEQDVPAALVATVRLGQYNGLHLLVRARAHYPDLPVIMIGPESAVLARDARALGAAAYMAQPVEVAALLARVLDLVERSADAEPSVQPASAASHGAPA